jgi:cytochrome c peroxidase
VATLFVGAAAALLGVPLPRATSLNAAPPVLPDRLGSLGAEPVPLPTNLENYVADVDAAKRLGKALFWDMQAGSDGVTACASCHYAAGTDNRSRNSVSPGGPDSGMSAFTGALGPNHDLTPDDFPFVKHATPGDPGSPIISETPAIVGSQGVVPSTFNAILAGLATEDTTPAPADPVFSDGTTNVRRVTGRRTPSVINAVFNHRNFWDGRARNHFNGVNPVGELDPDAKVAQSVGGAVSLVAIPPADLNNASLASQAVGPPGNDVEMSASGRTLRDIGKKLLNLEPLGGQRVEASDSLLGPLADGSDGRGLSTTYRALAEQAFHPKWWNAPDAVLDAGGNVSLAQGTEPDAALPSGRYSLMQYNWPLIWGLSINLYESTLVSDQTPFDRYAEGDFSALSMKELSGLEVFTFNCSTCHGGREMTEAAVSNVASTGSIDTDGRGHRLDTGFMNVGVRPQGEDLGNGADRGAGVWSDTKRTQPCNQPADCLVDGSFKMPGLRNVALQAPYFHNGGQLSLAQVVDFYNRGGDFANPNKHREIGALGLTATQKDDLVVFLEALTDPRVERQSAPFDHPQLFVPNGHATQLTGGASGAADNLVEVPATGAIGGAPLPRFLAPPAIPNPPGSTPPGVAQPPTMPAASLWLSRIRMAKRLVVRTARSKGFIVKMSVPTGATMVRLRIVQKVATKGGRSVERALVSRLDVPVTAGTARLRIPAKRLRHIKAGRYFLQLAPGATTAQLGSVSAVGFLVVR